MCVVSVHEFLVCMCMYVRIHVKCVGNAVVTYISKVSFGRNKMMYASLLVVFIIISVEFSY